MILTLGRKEPLYEETSYRAVQIISDNNKYKYHGLKNEKNHKISVKRELANCQHSCYNR